MVSQRRVLSACSPSCWLFSKNVDHYYQMAVGCKIVTSKVFLCVADIPHIHVCNPFWAQDSDLCPILNCLTLNGVPARGNKKGVFIKTVYVETFYKHFIYKLFPSNPTETFLFSFSLLSNTVSPTSISVGLCPLALAYSWVLSFLTRSLSLNPSSSS